MKQLSRTHLARPALAILLLASLDSLDAPAQLAWTQQAPAVPSAYGKLPLSFEANHGQTDPRVRFLARGSGYSIFLTEEGAVLALSGSASCNPGPSTSACPEDQDGVLRMTLAGPGRRLAPPQAEEELPGYRNYFVGNDPAKWRTQIPTFAKVRYKGVYPGIDLVYYGNQSRLEYDFVVAPGANPSRIQLHLAGSQRLAIANNGDLQLNGLRGQPTFRKPVLYQETAGRRIPVRGRFELLAPNTLGFRIAKYDHTRPLVIDPILTYSTYLGGSSFDQGNAVAVDSSGYAYVAGAAHSTDFPITSGAYQSVNKAAADTGATVFVAKFNPAGTALVYSTFLGGSVAESASAIALDPSGAVYLTGWTTSSDFPVTAGAFQTTNKSAANQWESAFVTKLNAAGDGLEYSTYLGGTATSQCSSYQFPGGGQAGLAIAVDSGKNAYISGDTNAADFPTTPGAFQTHYAATGTGAENAFVAKLNPQGTALLYSTYLGGAGNGAECYVEGDYAAAIVLDSSGDAYVAGGAASANFPVTAGAYQTVNRGAPNVRGSNAFVTKLNPTGTAEIFSTFVGGTGGDAAGALALDTSGSIYISGSAGSADFPVSTGAVYPTPSLPEGFVAKLNPSATELDYATYFGGSWSSLAGLAVDSSGSAYFTGFTGGSILATTPGAITQFTALDEGIPYVAYVAKLNPKGTAIDYATMIGSPTSLNWSAGSAVALDAADNLYVTGYAASDDFPVTSGAFQTINHSNSHWGDSGNAFLAKLALGSQVSGHYPTSAAVAVSSALTPQGQPVTVTATITSAAGVAPATGSVTFVTTTGTFNATLNASGVATWTTSTLPPGLYTAGVYYQGDATHLASAAATNNFEAVTFRVVGPPAIVTLADGNGNPAVVPYGNGLAPISVTVTDSTGYPLQGVAISFSATPGLNVLFGNTDTNANGIGYIESYSTAAGTFIVSITVAGYATPLQFTVKVLPAPLTVTIHPSFTWRLYGAANPTFTNTLSGLLGSETVTVTDTLAATPASPAGSYPVSATISGPDAAHYSLTVDGFNLLVNKAPLYIAAKNVAIVYGQTPPSLTAYTLSGFVNGDTASVVSGAPVLTTNVTSRTPVGSYKIGVQVGTLSAANYAFNTAASGEGSVVVSKAPLVLHPNSVTIHVGDPLPAFTYTITGFVNGDTQASSTSGAPVLTTTAPNTNAPGRYYIVANIGSLSAPNYSFNQPSAATNGILTILAN